MIGTMALADRPELPPIMLSRAGVEVGIAPRLAGRIVLARRHGGPNALLADPATCDPEERPPELVPGWDFKPYNGHIVWIGPQREWWMHQDVAADKRERKDNWAPDPWGEYASYRVDARSAAAATCVGPASPVTGLQLTKEVRIEADGSIRVGVTARNTRATPVRWDLWSNTRVPGTHRVFVAVDRASRVRVERSSSTPWTQTGLADEVVDGWFTFRADEPIPADKTARVAKAFLVPRQGLIAACGDGQVFVKRFSVTAAERVAPDHSPVEIFQLVSRDAAANLLELEAHGPYTTLEPGATMSFEETWTLADAGGATDAKACAALLNRMSPTR